LATDGRQAANLTPLAGAASMPRPCRVHASPMRDGRGNRVSMTLLRNRSKRHKPSSDNEGRTPKAARTPSAFIARSGLSGVFPAPFTGLLLAPGYSRGVRRVPRSCRSPVHRGFSQGFSVSSEPPGTLRLILLPADLEVVA